MRPVVNVGDRTSGYLFTQSYDNLSTCKLNRITWLLSNNNIREGKSLFFVT